MNPLDTLNYSYLKMTSKVTLLVIYIHLVKAIHLNCDCNLCHTMYIINFNIWLVIVLPSVTDLINSP